MVFLLHLTLRTLLLKVVITVNEVGESLHFWVKGLNTKWLPLDENMLRQIALKM
jgi:hypothetical protein